ncbi:syntaxin 1B/2/3 [Angomonas deanei]|uniref:Syntaxin/SNARE domain containing protein, putative n=1 Tax=Angomonas deanei TaxID=59799 RepID=S9VI62_9TRYP|nr:syntaxin 1B/2/3 [Angomonas deanei]EPY42482.1 syntaxin 1B/2/3 [Angomonas deanei]CAD2218877.1 Syntaxin/SNARE domain containing protein, putative [Angomonas deanei]|eukprot:EPY31344.1 syntaxin 1B/2/3 [Angomonas deanei]
MDRLPQLRKVAGMGGNKDFSPAEGDGETRVTFDLQGMADDGPMDEAMKVSLEINKETAETLDAFYADVSKVGTEFDAVNEYITQLQAKHQENIQNVDDARAKVLRKEIDQFSVQINDKATEVKTFLDTLNKKTATLKETPESCAANPAVIRIQENQYNYLVYRFTALMAEYARQQTVNENFYKAQTQRQIKIKCSNPDGSTIDDAQAAALAEQILENQVSLEDNYIFQQSKSVLANVIETRNDIMRIEQSMRTLNQLFNDLAFLVHEQGELIDIVLNNVKQANNYVEQGRKELKKARKYQKKSKKKMFCLICCVVVIVVLIIIAGVLGGVLPTR